MTEIVRLVSIVFILESSKNVLKYIFLFLDSVQEESGDDGHSSSEDSEDDLDDSGGGKCCVKIW
jgi:hypothetical protein